MWSAIIVGLTDLESFVVVGRAISIGPDIILVDVVQPDPGDFAPSQTGQEELFVLGVDGCEVTTHCNADAFRIQPVHISTRGIDFVAVTTEVAPPLRASAGCTIAGTVADATVSVDAVVTLALIACSGTRAGLAILFLEHAFGTVAPGIRCTFGISCAVVVAGHGTITDIRITWGKAIILAGPIAGTGIRHCFVV